MVVTKGIEAKVTVQAIVSQTVVAFHSGHTHLFQNSKSAKDGASYINVSINDAVILPTKNKASGSFHWNFERFFSISLVPLTITSVINGAHPITDLCLGIILPIHCHIGFDTIITDYLPAHRSPKLNKVSTWGLKGATLLVLSGCYMINTLDVGMTEIVKRVWHA
ncbi:23819_t:CDS:2 [Entrophospora sp. SA101]|nr:9417_t:CDS:2 [Entrophospora sp. SA101]CAJ0755071.1 11722_t:CDS:2 [Entrophospora sp. SA101]CAJ0759435.1 23819_t:CDS:2 [Entrophospora sp. SA101]CAJ0827830.1 7139_t:CDS:2 [Entrophospora sp. SA101]CAJ0884299.1 12730_t:CDS:2 [Entrophospora sp. SA101]